MKEPKFRRNTHDENGRHKPFSREAMLFWHTAGYSVGEILRLEVALTFADILTACAEYLAENEPGTPAKPEHVLWCLAQLVRYGLAEIVFEPAQIGIPQASPARYQLPLALAGDEQDRPYE